jgi:hypothetical protein
MGLTLAGGNTNAYEVCQLKSNAKPNYGKPEFSVKEMYVYQTKLAQTYYGRCIDESAPAPITTDCID